MIRSLDQHASWHGRLQLDSAASDELLDHGGCSRRPELAKRRIAVRVDVDSEPAVGAVEFFGWGG